MHYHANHNSTVLVCVVIELFMICIATYVLVLGNISIFWKYRDILFDNIRYHENFLISKYHASIFIVFINLIYVTDEVYSLDMSTYIIL